ncbi:MAG: hypothetical protein FI687_07110 [SAR202 cluster bacterium]|nr:hypothetical protein [SAR202 cluster bacterium]|tara:strand:- start:6321 stop:6902 length:582 start_codon:yes stop_codon:yes gene_type:complete
MVDKFREKIRDKSRDELTKSLTGIGIDAEMSTRGLKEEKIGKSWLRSSLGIINIQDQSVKWINVVKQNGSQHSPPKWFFIYFIPDIRISNQNKIKIKTFRKRSFLLIFGKIIDVTWSGNDINTGLSEILNSDLDMKNFVKKIGDIQIESHSDIIKGWTIRLETYRRNSGPPSVYSETWKNLQKITQQLLSLPI